jgi:energy-coupling factor transporter transmembrane protein EcfT
VLLLLLTADVNTSFLFFYCCEEVPNEVLLLLLFPVFLVLLLSTYFWFLSTVPFYKAVVVLLVVVVAFVLVVTMFNIPLVFGAVIMILHIFSYVFHGFPSLIQVACGLNHTLAVSADGNTVWAFGDGDYGKLGLGSSTAKTSPQVIDALSGTGIRKVCCGTQFSVVLTKDVRLFSFGQGIIGV